MKSIKLTLKRPPRVPVYAESLTPDKLKDKNPQEIRGLELLEGNSKTTLDNLFDVEVEDCVSNTDGLNLTIKGELTKFRYIGKGMTGGCITINGNVGFYLGQEMEGGSIKVNGNVGPWAGAMMKGGQIEVNGNAGDFLAAPYRGMKSGMVGGSVLIHGDAGVQVGRKMKGGLISIDGGTGLFLGFGMQGGEILVKGSCAGRAGAEMEGGKIIVLGQIPQLLPTFTFSELKEKVKFGEDKISASFYVYMGDILKGGAGKIFISRCRNKHLNPIGEIFPDPPLNLNRSALPYVEKMLLESQRLGVAVVKDPSGATIIDAGVHVKGSVEAGVLVSLICMGGLAEISTGDAIYGGLKLPSLQEVVVGHPAAVTLGAQFAGWAIKTDDYYALGSGPARAISLQPKKLYEKLCYSEPPDVAVLVVESDKLPSESAIEYVASACKVEKSRLFIVVAPTSSVVGSVQVAGRVVETGIHKLTEVGFHPNKILSGRGSCPIAPVHPNSTIAMGITNDMILYGGDVYYEVKCRSDDEIVDVIDEVPSTSSRDYGRPFYETFKASGCDFYKIDAGLFAPARITIKNTTTGNSFTAGKISPEILEASLGLLKVSG
ncbi:MAG: methenyltetrahydromethanopterin cyclohydrolase [Candidatus Bathyarchaeia archaeon]